MTKQISFFLAIILILILSMATAHSDNNPSLTQSKPIIYNIVKDPTFEGYKLSIKGTNFGSTRDSSFVLFDNEKVSHILSWSNSEIVIIVMTDELQGKFLVSVNNEKSNQFEFNFFEVPLYSLIPFIFMLGSIAVLPLIAHKWWDVNRNKLIVALVLGIPVAIWLFAVGMTYELEHAIVYDYIPFIILLGSLFVITGGIFVDGNIEAKPKNNAIILGIGAILASFMGTTGAAMLLIRPLIHTNRERQFKVHIILFFIAIVANCGGLLTPLGDPPLFMMYLRGAPFFWFFHFIWEWLFVNGILLIIFFFVDSHFWKKESQEVKIKDHDYQEPIKLQGKFNFIFLLGVVLSVALINPNTLDFVKSTHPSSYLREASIALMAILSLVFTKKQIRISNNFNWHPINEVAFLFLGIFITMVPCLSYLETHAKLLGVDTPNMFYYATGILSSFLDNTPTAVTFYSLAVGLVTEDPSLIANTATVAGIPEILMYAICTAAVYFGAMTYIGNGPNFMVKAIAESEGIKMPDFFSYMIKFSIIVLLPLFVLCELIFILKIF